MLSKRLATRVARWLGAGLISISILSWIAGHSGPKSVDVVVHVSEPDVEVDIGGRVFRVGERPETPLVCRLPPGRYELVTRRGGRVLQREPFEVGRRENVVLAAQDAAGVRVRAATPGHP